MFILSFLTPSQSEGAALDIDSLESVLDALSSKKRSIGNDTATVEVLNLLCWTYRLSDLGKAREYGKRGLKLARKITIASSGESSTGWKYGIAKSLGNLGLVNEFEGNTSKAIEYYTQSLELHQELGNDVSIAYNLNNLGAVNYYQGNYNQAIDYYYQALNIQEESGNQKGIANCYNNLGLLFQRQGETDKAIEYFIKSMKIDKASGNKEDLSHSLNKLANVYKKRGDYEKAIEYNLESLQIKQEVGNKSGIAASLNNLGLIYSEQDQYDKALEAYNQSLALENELGNVMGTAISLVNIGELHLEIAQATGEKKHIEIAIDNLKQGLGVIGEKGDKYLIHLIYEYLSEAYEAQNNYKEAFQYYKLFSALKDTLFNEDKSKDIGKLEAKYEMEQKIKEENRIEAEDARLAAEEESRRNNLQYSGILIFLVLLTAGIVMTGRVSIPVRLAEGLIFFTFLLFFEFTLVLLDPYIESYSSGAPAIKLSFNAILAGLIFPLHAFFENQLKSQIISRS